MARRRGGWWWTYPVVIDASRGGEDERWRGTVRRRETKWVGVCAYGRETFEKKGAHLLSQQI
jgi:hypothetical protein